MEDQQTELLPARMIHEFVYCPRVFWLEHVEGVFVDNEHTVRGQHEHRRVDRPGGKLPAPAGDQAREAKPPDGIDAEPTIDATERDADRPPWHARALWLSDPELGVSAKLDLVVPDGPAVLPVDTKKGRSNSGALWPADRVQLNLHALLLRAHGYACDEIAAWYVAERRRVVEPITDASILEARAAIAGARQCAQRPLPPPPLADSPKCHGCSLNVVCLPDEVHALSAARALVPCAGDELRRVVPMRDDALPLYVQTPNATVGLSGECLRVETPGGAPVLVGLPQTAHVSIFGTARLSTQALQQCLRRGIPVAYFTTRGWFYGLTDAIDNHQVHVRVAQFAFADKERGLAIARTIVADKIANQRTILRRNGDASEAVLRRLRDYGRRAADAPSRGQLLGLEGGAAREYWTEYARLLPDEWRFTRRSRRPPEDPTNALLSFGYALLVKDAMLAARFAGLDPHYGVFHTHHHGRPSLALDLMETFRPLIVDSLVLQMINRGEVAPHEFVWTGQAVAMKPAARTATIRGYERRVDELVTHPAFGYRISYRQMLTVQARLLSRALLGEIASVPSIRTR